MKNSQLTFIILIYNKSNIFEIFRFSLIHLKTIIYSFVNHHPIFRSYLIFPIYISKSLKMYIAIFYYEIRISYFLDLMKKTETNDFFKNDKEFCL